MTGDMNKHRRRTIRTATPIASHPMQIEVEGKRYVNFSSNDYFGLSQHLDVIVAAQEALARYGAGAGASRLVTGNHPLYEQLECQLAEMKGTQAALIYGSGYLANIGVISTLIGRGDIMLADKLVHACMIDGAKLSGATLRRFAHNDMAALEALLQKYTGQGRLFILTETIFSMDGDHAPIAEMLALCERYDAMLISDDAHGLGIVPPQPHPRHIQIGTLSKGVGAYGGYVCCSDEIREQLVNHSRSLIFSTALPAATLGAASKALELMKTGDVWERLARHVEIFRHSVAHDAAYVASVSTESTCQLLMDSSQSLRDSQNDGAKGVLSPIIPIILGSDEAALAAQTTLAEAGFWVSAIRPPTVPEGSARLRITLSAAHKKEDVKELAELIEKITK